MDDSVIISKIHTGDTIVWVNPDDNQTNQTLSATVTGFYISGINSDGRAGQGALVEPFEQAGERWEKVPAVLITSRTTVNGDTLRFR
jgi:hypothetical protein